MADQSVNQGNKSDDYIQSDEMTLTFNTNMVNNRSKDCQLDKIDASAQSTTETTIIDPLSFLHSISESTIGIQKIERIKQLNMHIKTMDSEEAQSILNAGFCIELLELICDDQTHIQKELLSIPGSIAQIQ